MNRIDRLIQEYRHLDAQMIELISDVDAPFGVAKPIRKRMDQLEVLGAGRCVICGEVRQGLIRPDDFGYKAFVCTDFMCAKRFNQGGAS